MGDRQNPAGEYVVHPAEYSAIGAYANVNNNLPPQQAAAGPGVADLRRLFEEESCTGCITTDWIAATLRSAVRLANSRPSGDRGRAG